MRPVLAALLAAGAMACAPEPTAWLVPPPRTPTRGPLRRSPSNPHYLVTPDGNAVYLAGAHTWSNLQDNGPTDPPARFDFNRYLDSVTTWGHNFFRLWAWEQARWATEVPGDYWFDPLPFARTGPDTALDGKPRFDLTRFNEAYFERLRARVGEAGRRGFYVSVMLFDGWSIERKTRRLGNPWRGHPFNAANNVNGIDGDPDRDGVGLETHTLALPPITAVQEAYLRRVIDAVNEFDNVLFEISNESPAGSERWQYHMIEFVHRYEAALPQQHPVGMTVEYPGGDSQELLRGAADWISPNRQFVETPFPTPETHGKVVIEDSDHLCGVCKDAPWVWEAMFRGSNPAFMDMFYRQGAGVGARPEFNPGEPRWVGVRRALGLTRALAERIGIGDFRPGPALASTGQVLAAIGPGRFEVLVYVPEGGGFSVDLSALSGRGSLEWIRPATGAIYAARSVPAGERRWLTAPFRGAAIARLSSSTLSVGQPVRRPAGGS